MFKFLQILWLKLIESFYKWIHFSYKAFSIRFFNYNFLSCCTLILHYRTIRSKIEDSWISLVCIWWLYGFHNLLERKIFFYFFMVSCRNELFLYYLLIAFQLFWKWGRNVEIICWISWELWQEGVVGHYYGGGSLMEKLRKISLTRPGIKHLISFSRLCT